MSVVACDFRSGAGHFTGSPNHILSTWLIMNPTTFLPGWIGLCLCIFGETKQKEGASGEFLVVHVVQCTYSCFFR